MRATLTTLALGLAAAAATAAADNFIGSCDADSVKIISGKVLTANCRQISGPLRCSRLDLNRCLKNTYGSLQADPTGSGPHFGDQCVDCSNSKTNDGILINAPTLLHCACDPGTGAAQASWPTAIFGINTIVDNNNGVLECYGIKGTSC
ncbi:hypothetical protein QBC46DRAFT_321115 [Diplogelasinospora grovesii]|uniref:Cyanovirin-N domain-containing protein n=1 Tax=Diplogelasinospora grovesii TaxID=303347 RepID=A0AAN6S1K3_9PEZI|nr:hypothetical protein QBC46DRAFT_321115 [Diplogelasinospora grovesii]